MELNQVIKLLHCDWVSDRAPTDLAVEQAYASDLMSDILVKPRPGALLLTGLTNIQVIRTSKVAGIRVIVFVRGKEPQPEAVKKSNEYGIPLLTTSACMFDASGILYEHGLRGVSGIQRAG